MALRTALPSPTHKKTHTSCLSFFGLWSPGVLSERRSSSPGQDALATEVKLRGEEVLGGPEQRPAGLLEDSGWFDFNHRIELVGNSM